MAKRFGWRVGMALLVSFCLPSCNASSSAAGCDESPEMVLDRAGAESHLEKVVEPAYPPSAPRRGIPLAVELMIQVDAEGRICAVEIVSGHPSLVEPAREAARRWKFRRFFLDFKPVPTAVGVSIEFDPQRRREVHRTLLPRDSSELEDNTPEIFTRAARRLVGFS